MFKTNLVPNIDYKVKENKERKKENASS